MDAIFEIKELEVGDVFTFGQYKGLPIGVIIEKDPDYIFWAERNVMGFYVSRDCFESAVYHKFTQVMDNRSAKEKEISEINQRISEMPKAEKDKKRRKYFKNKSKQ